MAAWLPDIDSSILLDSLKSLLLLEAPSPAPRVTIQLSEPGRIHLVLRFPAPDRGRSRIEQAILRGFLARSCWGLFMRVGSVKLQAVLYSWSFIGVYVFFGSTLFSSPHSTRWSNMVRRH